MIAEAGGCRKEYSRGFLTGWKPRADVHGHRDDNGRAAGHVFPGPASTVQPMRGRSEIDPNPPTECSHHHSVMNGSPTRAAQPPAAPTSPSPIDRRLRIPVQMPSLVFGGKGGCLCLRPKLDSIATSSALQAMLARTSDGIPRSAGSSAGTSSSSWARTKAHPVHPSGSITGTSPFQGATAHDSLHRSAQ